MGVKTYQNKYAATKLSKNFSVSEFRCGLGRGCSCKTALIDGKLVEYLQAIRDYFGKPITITSAHRCESYNRSVGGATGSRHTKGQAADIVVQGITPAKVAAYAESIGIKGIGLYETAADGHFVHIDTRTAKSFWYGQAQAARSTFGGAAAAGTASSSTSSTKPAEDTTAANGYSMEEFTRDIQKAFGAAVDGIAGQETLSSTKTLSAKENHTHKAVEAVQRRLLALEYNEVGKADGTAGPKFTSAVAHFQQDNGCVVDGEITAKGKTWQKLLGMS